MNKEHITVSIDKNSDLIEKLDAIAYSKGISREEVIKRSIITYKTILCLLQSNPDNKLSITDKNDTVVKDIILY